MPTEHFMRLKNDRKNAIIKAATREFATKDYADVSVRDIADQAGISRGSFYLYFNDKEDAYITAINTYRQRLEQDLFNIYKKAKDVPDVVLQVFDYFTHLSAFEHSFFEKISNNLSLEVQDILANTLQKFGDTVNECLEQDLIKQGIKMTPEIKENLILRRDIMFSLLVSALIEMGLNHTPLDKARETLQKKVNIVIAGFNADFLKLGDR